MGSVLRDLRDAARRLRRAPGFTAVVVATLTLAVGLDTTVFSLVDAVLLRPPPVAAPERLLHVYSAVPGGLLRQAPMAFPDYEDLRARATSFTGLAAYAWYPLALDRADGAELLTAEIVTSNYFATLGVEPLRGRLYGPEDDGPGAPGRVVVLSHDAWRRYFAGAESVLGGTVQLNGRGFTVVGVAPPEFRGLTPALAPDLWLPLHAGAALPTGITINFGGPTPGLARTADRAARWVWVTGRLRPGVTAAAAGAEVAAVGKHLAAEQPATNGQRDFVAFAAGSVRLLPAIDGALAAGSLGVLAVFVLVLVIAALNLAGLFLARALGRRREIATRLALGASRLRLARQLAVEGLLLALAGGAAGLALAGVAAALLPSVRLPLVLPVRIALAPRLDLPVLLFTAGAVALVTVLCALLPALAATRVELASLLRELGGGAASRRQRRVRGTLVGAQVAVATLLLVGAGLALRSLGNAARVDPGFVPAGLAVATLSPDLAAYEGAAMESYWEGIEQKVAELPGVERVAWASHLPLTFAINFTAVADARRASDDPAIWPAVDAAAVGAGYFETLRVPLLAGRGFDDRDVASRPGVAVINETLARSLWPGMPAVGQRLRVAGVGGPLEVVGVVRDGKYRTLGERPRPFLYFCLGQAPRGTRSLIVRARGALDELLPALLATVRGLDPRVPVSRPTRVEEALAGVLLLPRVAAALLGAFGVLALLLAAVGIYGVVAFLARSRTREIGLRLALGATRVEVVGWLLRRGLGAVALGLAAGLALAAVTVRLLSDLLYGLRPLDPPTFLGVAILLAAVALAAAALPARRASGIEPAAALRQE